MSDKTRREFEAWAKTKGVNIVMHSDGEKYAFNQRCFEAWQHQQAIIDTKDAEIVTLKNTAAELATMVIELERKK